MKLVFIEKAKDSEFGRKTKVQVIECRMFCVHMHAECQCGFPLWTLKRRQGWRKSQKYAALYEGDEVRQDTFPMTLMSVKR